MALPPDADAPHVVALRERFSALCAALPEVTVEHLGHGHAVCTVRKRRFAWFLCDHHGDGRVAASCRVPDGENTALAASDPLRFYLPAYLGPRGWVAVDLLNSPPDWAHLGALVTTSYRLIAPARLARGLG